ncbi:hypothetical protein B0I26_1192 [Anoxybacillus vitaminiphilus]|uniref:ABC-2 type transport system permease protein n=1 Tax=Paranoxybacillus vitaminiphilus TaxID=581036 RepID=A0A327Y5S8_9BACL|nr:hypothetical protein B0I26_1192 [Anoxybacillus vitaminiphilus]
MTVSSRDLEKSFYSAKISNYIHRFFRNAFLKKDILYLIRSPKLFSVYVTPILFTSVLEIKNQFASSGILLTVFIQIFALIITGMTLSILQSDDYHHSDLLFSIPFNIEELFQSRSRLLHILSFLITSSYISIVCVIESVPLEYYVYGIIQLFIFTYISSRVMAARIIRKSNKDSRGYRYKGSIAKVVIYFSFVWNIPLLICFCILYEYLRRILEVNYLSNHASFVMLVVLVMVIGMLYRSMKINI